MKFGSSASAYKMETLSDLADKVFLCGYAALKYGCYCVVGSPLDLLYNNAQGLEQITFKTVWKEGNMMASRSLGTCPSNKEE